MQVKATVTLLVASALVASFACAETPTVRWATVDRLNIRSCPATSCGITGWITYGNKVTIYEEKDEWSRISQESSAMCEDGISAAIDTGNRNCTAENGIRDGKLSRWVSSQHLTDVEPKPVSAPLGCEGDLLSGSDNYDLYAGAFCTAALRMISDGTCTKQDFRKWAWSASTKMGNGIYFTYCGGMAPSNRYYLDVKSGRIFQ